MGDHRPMRIAEFELERFFARWEFAVRYLLCASDVEGWRMADLLALADDETAALWSGLRLGYTEAPGHPLRFRANLSVDGWPAWHEFGLLGQEIAIGDVRLKVTKRIRRCAAINVDPDTGIRELALPDTLLRTFDHADCGVYAQVIAGGEIAVGDTVSP